jgi:hypothetical protein
MPRGFIPFMFSFDCSFIRHYFFYGDIYIEGSIHD